jgi:mannose-6-phosphate isomerase-like protein (cupin superfamily)
MKLVDKAWGYEVWFENNEMYCGKMLKVLQDKWSSKGRYHYHKKKMETFIVIEGELLLDIADEKGTTTEYILTPYESIRVKPGTKHRFTSNTPQTKFIEVSTTHSDDDSYRCIWSHTERKWIDV